MPNRLIDVTGKRFSMMTVLSRAQNSQKGKTRWLCKCDCGTTKIMDVAKLKNGNTKSCGCARYNHLPQVQLGNIKHGHWTKRRSSEYLSWSTMIQRCRNPNNPEWKNYGARGISVCERWLNFFNFLDDMGKKPNRGYAIHRMNNDGNYEPTNCKWISASEHARLHYRIRTNGKSGRLR